jgi:hypothetical protein
MSTSDLSRALSCSCCRARAESTLARALQGRGGGAELVEGILLGLLVQDVLRDQLGKAFALAPPVIVRRLGPVRSRFRLLDDRLGRGHTGLCHGEDLLRLANLFLFELQLRHHLGHPQLREDVVLVDRVADVDVPFEDVPRDLRHDRRPLERLDEAGLTDLATDRLSLRLDHGNAPGGLFRGGSRFRRLGGRLPATGGHNRHRPGDAGDQPEAGPARDAQRRDWQLFAIHVGFPCGFGASGCSNAGS